MQVTSNYLQSVLTPHGLAKAVDEAVEVIGDYAKEFDSIAFRGVSGGLVGPMVAVKLNKGMLVIRKNENRHSDLVVEGYNSCKRYLIIDDLVFSGKTVEEIALALGNSHPEARCVGTYMYNQEGNDKDTGYYRIVKNKLGPFAVNNFVMLGIYKESGFV